MSLQFARKGLQNGNVRLVIALALAIALLLPATMGASAQQLMPSGESCVEGLVIDWQENPLEDGWYVRATPIVDGQPVGDPIDILPSDEDGEEGQFSIDTIGEDELDPHMIAEKWQFEIFFLEGSDAPNIENPDDFTGFLVGDWRGVTPTSFEVTLDTTSGKCTRVRFKLKEIVTVLVTKIDADHTLLPDWTIYATPAKDNKFAEQLDGDTDDNGSVLFELTPGKWIFTEASPDDVGNDYYPVIPVTGQQELNVESAADRADDDDPGNDYEPSLVDYVLRFKNEVGLGGCIKVIKKDLAPAESEFSTDFPLAGWEISVLRTDGTEETFGYTDATGMVKFEGLAFGPYTIKEETRVGWELVTDPVDDEIHGDYEQALASSVKVTVTDSACTLVRFVNQQAPAGYTIEGRKLDANGHYGIPGWKIEATPLDKGGLELDPVFTDGSGYYKFELPGDDYRIPGSKYKVCEDDDVDGWENVSSTCFTVTIPKTLGGTASVPDFVNKQVGHSTSSGGSSWSGGGMSGGWGMDKPMGGMDKPMGGMEMKCSKYHKVMKGEGLYDIGAMYMKPAGAMLAANPWIQSRPNHYLYPGDEVCVP